MRTTKAWAKFEVKSFDEERRTIEGVASTPSTDRSGDVVEPMGAEFELPIPFLYQHDSTQPIGNVVRARPTSAGISVEVQLAKVDEPGTLKDRLDEAWHSIKAKLVRGLSIGFKPIEYERINGGGLRFTKWSWLELSAVTIPCNSEATITAIKRCDSQERGALLNQFEPGEDEIVYDLADLRRTGKRMVHGIASSPAINSHKYSLSSKGAFYQLPVPLLCGHGHVGDGQETASRNLHSMAIGEIVWACKTERGIFVRGVLDDSDAADHAWSLIQGGELGAMSGAIAENSKRMPLRLKGVVDRVKFYDRWELGEVSLCRKGANPDSRFEIYRPSERKLLKAVETEVQGRFEYRTLRYHDGTELTKAVPA